MSKVFVVGYDNERSIELRAKRQLTLRLTSAEPLASEYIIVANQGVPIWISEIESFTVPTGIFPKPITINFGKIVFLENDWNEVAGILRYMNEDLTHGKIVSLDVKPLLSAGDKLPANDTPRQGSLSVDQAKARLAWTYGVEEAMVRISIDL